MSSKKFKFNGCGTHRRAVLHMIGQSVDIFNAAPTVAEIATWMNVCKRTATKYLKMMVERGEIIMTKEKYKNTFRYRIKLDPFVDEHYKNRILEDDYKWYAQRVMKVTLLW